MGTCPDAYDDGCSGGHRENTQNRLPETLPDVFGVNSANHSGDYSGASPGHTPRSANAEPRNAHYALACRKIR